MVIDISTQGSHEYMAALGCSPDAFQANGKACHPVIALRSMIMLLALEQLMLRLAFGDDVGEQIEDLIP